MRNQHAARTLFVQQGAGAMDKPLVEVKADVHAGPDAVWRILTARKSAMFMGADVESDWREGSPISFTGEFDGRPFRDHGEIRSVEAGRHLAFTHFSPTSGKPDTPDNYNLVDVRLDGDGDRTQVTLSQTPLGGDRPDDATIEMYRKNWTVMLDGLRKAAELDAFGDRP
jgi:uncharacterized protein YndB with AHSA1/START domain